MSNITIPPEALEAGTDIIRDYRKAGVTSDQIARAAFLAMLTAWPGMHLGAPWVIGVPNATSIILPLEQEASDD